MTIIGIPIGFYGYLFPGNINLMVVELYCKKQYKQLAIILILIIVFESIYCGMSLTFLHTIKNNSNIYKSLEFISYLLIFLMGLWMVLEKNKKTNTSHQNTITRGVLSIIIHPQQIPFWLVVGVLVNSIEQSNLNSESLALFIIFNAIGTVLAMFSYMFLGKRILDFFKLNIAQINKIMGFAYIILALYHLFY